METRRGRAASGDPARVETRRDGAAPLDEPRLPAAAAETALVAIAAVWGITFVMVQDAVALIPVMTFLAYRFLPAAALVAIVFRRPLRTLGRDGVLAGAGMGAFLTAGYVFQTLGLERTTASKAGFITGLMVVLTPVFGALFLRDRAGGIAWLAAGVSAVGLYLLTGAGGELDVAGDGLVLLCACAFAFHILFTGRAVRHHHFGALLVVQLAVAGLFSVAVAAAAGDLVVPRDATVWSALAVTSIVGSALGFLVQTYAQQHAPPARTALILASEPAFAGLFAYLLQGETLGLDGWTGAGLILGAIVMVQAVPALRPSRPLPEE
ncbi:MAG TPA: DMT family transporter [Actinomycetota bacterium]|nr:DMT family transporter [Actinomycetota bacterium]